MIEWQGVVAANFLVVVMRLLVVCSKLETKKRGESKCDEVISVGSAEADSTQKVIRVAEYAFRLQQSGKSIQRSFQVLSLMAEV